MMETVFLVDDDPGVTRALGRVLNAEGWMVEAFDSAESFLEKPAPEAHGCLVLDVCLSGLSGLGLHQHLQDAGRSLPTIFLSGEGDVPTSVQAIKAGASDFLTKPVGASRLIGAVRDAFDEHESLQVLQGETNASRQRYASLTCREREVLSGLARGRLNKQIAGDLGIVEQTVKFHRARIMDRMNARTVAELMHMVAKLDL